MPNPFQLNDLSDLDDPGGRKNPFGDAGPFGRKSPFASPVQQRPRFPAAAPAAVEAARSSFVDRGLSGLQYLGSVVDKPGRAVRGALAGNAREFLGAAVPFSDSMGLTDPKERVSGEDLLQHFGLMDKLKPGEEHPGFFSKRNLAGMGTEMVLDPGMFASFGPKALTTGGKAAAAIGATRNWSHANLIKGFTHHTDDLLAAGNTAEEIAHMVRRGDRVAPSGLAVKPNEPLSGAIGFGLPFGDTKFTLGHGGVSQAIAGGFDNTYKALKFAPGVRTLRQWVDTRAGRSADTIAQKAHEVAAVPTTGALKGAAGVWEHGARQRLDDLLRSDPALKGTEMQALDLVGMEGEKVGQAANHAAWTNDFLSRHAQGLTPGVTDPHAVVGHITRNWDEYRKLGDEMNQANKGFIPAAQHAGADPHQLAESEAEYLRRQYIAGQKSSGAPKSRPVQPFSTTGIYDRTRQEVLKDIPGGTATINKWAMDPRFSGAARTLPADQVRAGLFGDMFQHYQNTGRLMEWTPEVQHAMQQKAKHMTEFLESVDPIHSASSVPYFHPDRFADHTARAKAHATVVGNAKGAVEGLASGAVPLREFLPGGRFAGQAHTTLDKAVGEVGLHTHRPYAPTSAADLAHLQSVGVRDADHAREILSKAAADPAYMATASQIHPDVAARLGQQGYTGGSARLYEAMARHGAPLQDMTTGAFDPSTYLKGYAVHARDLDSLAGYMKGFVAPHEMTGFLKRMDGLQSLFKAFTYPLWPASHVRNAGSALYNNTKDRVGLGSMADAFKIMRNRGVAHHPGYGAAMAGLSDAERAQALAAQAYGHAGIFGDTSFSEVSRAQPLGSVDTLSGDIGKLAPGVPGADRAVPGRSFARDTAGIFGKMFGDLWSGAGRNPLGVRGVGGRTKDTFAPLIAGRKVGENVEDFARLSHFLSGLRKGNTSEVAGGLTKRTHFDYTDMTPMETNVFRKIFPFYTFARKNLPEQARLLAQEPRAIVPTIRAMTAGNTDGRQGYVPEWLSTGPAINMGRVVGPDGTNYKRFLSSFGTPIEEAVERLKFKQWELPNGHKLTAPDLLGTGMGYAGLANGYMKIPIEMGTDTQIHTGRKLSDLWQKTPWNLYGRIPEPFGSVLSEVGQNLPGTRVATTFNKLADDRKTPLMKALNTLTGVRVSDVDTDKAFELDARKALIDQLKTDPLVSTFEQQTVRQPNMASVSGRLRELMEIKAGMDKQARAQAEARRQAEATKRYFEARGIVPK